MPIVLSDPDEMTDLVHASELLDDMETWLGHDDDEEWELVPVESMTLAGKDEVNRALRAIAKANRKIAEIDEVVNAEKARLDRWRDLRARQYEATTEFFTRVVENWARAQHRETGTSTTKLPNGTLRLNKARPKIDTPDDVLETVEETWPNLVKVERSLRRREAAKAWKPGPPLTDTEGPEGYTRHAAVDTKTGMIVENVTILVPDDTTRSFTMKAEGLV